MLLMNGPACPTAQQYNRHNGFSPSYVPLALCEQGDKGAGLHPCSGFLRPTSEADTGSCFNPKPSRIANGTATGYCLSGIFDPEDDAEELDPCRNWFAVFRSPIDS